MLSSSQPVLFCRMAVSSAAVFFGAAVNLTTRFHYDEAALVALLEAPPPS